MSQLYATNGSKVYIGGAPKQSNGAILTASDFSGVTWTEIKGVTDLGTLGDVSALITSSVIGEGRDRKAKGTNNAGSWQIVADLDYADAGQIAAIAAQAARETYPFKVVLNDAPQGGTPSERYATALVMSAAEAYSQANNAMALNITIEVDSNVARVAASA